MVIDIPASSTNLRLTVFNTGHVGLKPSWYFTPSSSDVPALPKDLVVPSFVYLIEHPNGRRVLFDLGLRETLESHPPSLKIAISTIPGILKEWKAGDSIVTQLSSKEIALESVDTVIWSHYHLDHIGDLTAFPSSTKLVVGPGSLKEIQPGYPKRLTGQVMDKDTKGRDIIEVEFESTIGGLESHDFFGDGSLFLLNTPGHCIGHLAALVRTCPDQYIFLTGDAFHHPSQIRPNKGSPLNDRIEPLTKLTSFAGRSIIHADTKAYAKTISHLVEFDSDERIFIWGAHDTSLEGLEGELTQDTVSKIKEKKWTFLEFWQGKIKGPQKS